MRRTRLRSGRRDRSGRRRRRSDGRRNFELQRRCCGVRATRSRKEEAMDGMGDAMGTTQREAAHVTLWKKLQQLEVAVGRLEGLRRKIGGETPPPPSEREKEPEPTLAHVLQAAPHALMEQSERILQQVKDIQQMLF